MCAMEVDPPRGARRRRCELGRSNRSASGFGSVREATPNTTEDAERAIRDAHRDRGRGGGGGTPYQLTPLPLVWFRVEPGRDLRRGQGARAARSCIAPTTTGRCEFTKRAGDQARGIPLVVVDEEIYRLLPDAADRHGRQVRADAVERRGAERSSGGSSAQCHRHGFLAPGLRGHRAAPQAGRRCQQSSRSTSGRCGRPT